MTREDAAQAIKDLLLDRVEVEHDIDESNLYSGMDVDDLERVEDIERSINEQSDIIYYSRAMEYLSKEDPSLHEACNIAAEYGYETKNLSSEMLASCLNNERMRSAYYDCRDEIQKILDQIEEDEEIEGCKGVGLVSALNAKYDSRASFYGKAQVDDHDDHIALYSYNTLVANYDKATGVLDVYGWYSSTTARHIREFAKQLGIALPAGKDIVGQWR